MVHQGAAMKLFVAAAGEAYEKHTGHHHWERTTRLLIRAYVWSCGILTPHVAGVHAKPVCGRHVVGTVVL